jgi:hypothetical protein
MAGNTPGRMFGLLLTLAILVMVSGCTESNPPVVTLSPTPVPLTIPVGSTEVTTVTLPVQGCTNDDDCIPAECCHPTSCINKAEKGVCNMMCTMNCQGPIDCGAGYCGCVNGKCVVVASASPK